MKNYVCLFVAVFLWCSLMPTVIRPASDGQAAAAPEISTETEIESSYQNQEINVRYYDDSSNSMKELELEEYVALALTALMEEGLPTEMLKAQAVAIRSVVCYRYEHPEHEGFELCGEAEHCFALSDSARDDCKKAVEETKGKLITYEGHAALALSHLSSCIKTESYETLYGTKLPYLISVPVYDESGCKGYKTVTEISHDDFKRAFSDYSVTFGEEQSLWVSDTSFTEGNRVYTIDVGGLRFKGSTFAKLLNVPSLCFNIEENSNGFTINSYGNGHGVGMSRNSAVLMAKEGKNYEEILSYFYPNTNLSVIKNA